MNLLLSCGMVLLCGVSAAAQNLATLQEKLGDANHAHQLQQERLAVAQANLAQLQSDVQSTQERLDTARQQLGTARAQLSKKFELFLEDTRISFDAERQAYIAAKDALRQPEERLSGQRAQIAQSQREIESLTVELRRLDAVRQDLKQSVAELHGEELRQQIEREHVVEARGEFSCGQQSIADCKQMALAQAKRNAAEQGAAVLVQAATEVENFALSRDQVRTEVEALVLQYDILDADFVGSSGYFYHIRATIKGQLSPTLRQRLSKPSQMQVKARQDAHELLQQAIRFYSGIEGQLDMARARTLFTQAADTHDPLATMWLARCYTKGLVGLEPNADYGQQLAAQAIQDVTRLAQEENPEALFLLASAYDDGLAIEPNKAEAVSWYLKAADRGHPIAQNTLGTMYLEGTGVEQSAAKASIWFRKAAALGDTSAQYNLGLMYEHGWGVEANSIAALHWYRKASERGHRQAQERVQRHAQ